MKEWGWLVEKNRKAQMVSAGSGLLTKISTPPAMDLRNANRPLPLSQIEYTLDSSGFNILTSF